MARVPLVICMMLCTFIDGISSLSAEPKPVRASPGSELEGAAWLLNALEGGAQPLPGSQITAVFKTQAKTGRRSVSGVAGCNSYSAWIKVVHNQMRIEPAVSTAKYCARPEGLMEQERAYLSSLERVASDRLTDGRLELLSGDRQPLLIFVVSSETLVDEDPVRRPPVPPSGIHGAVPDFRTPEQHHETQE